MRWMTAVVLVALLVAGPMGALADGGRAAPDCDTAAAGTLQSTVQVD